MTEVPGNYLAWREVLELLQVSSPTLYKICARKELKPITTIRHGKQRRRYFLRADVEALKTKRGE